MSKGKNNQEDPELLVMRTMATIVYLTLCIVTLVMYKRLPEHHFLITIISGILLFIDDILSMFE